MDTVSRILKAAEFIEENLSNPDLSWEDASRAAFLSPYHFHRIFSSLTGESIGSYLRKRKLTSAAEKLIQTRIPISDIAAESGFLSQEAFTRAFKKQFHFTPAKFRKTEGASLLNGRLALTDEEIRDYQKGFSMPWQIIELPQISLSGMETTMTLREESRFTTFSARFCMKLPGLSEQIQDNKVFAVSFRNTDIFEDFDEDTPFSFFMGIAAKNSEKLPRDFHSFTLPAQKYAAFTHYGGFDHIEKSYEFIYGNWALSSGYELLPGSLMDFTIYDDDFLPQNPKESKHSICVPVK